LSVAIEVCLVERERERQSTKKEKKKEKKSERGSCNEEAHIAA